MTNSQPLRVLFLCTGNAARSQVAEALLRHLSKGRAAVFSAGSEPKREIHPLAKDTLQHKYGIDTVDLHPKSMRTFLHDYFDFVITLCDKAAETCPAFPGDPGRIHWSFEDPTLVEGADAQRRAFEAVANGLMGRLRIWMSLPDVRKRLDAEHSGNP